MTIKREADNSTRVIHWLQIRFRCPIELASLPESGIKELKWIDRPANSQVFKDESSCRSIGTVPFSEHGDDLHFALELLGLRTEMKRPSGSFDRQIAAKHRQGQVSPL